MSTHMSRLRGALVLLLIGSACLFFVGSTIERHNRHHEAAAAPAAESSTSGESGSEGSKPAEKHVEGNHGEAGAKILGINTESLALSIVAVVLSLLLAVAIWLGLWVRLVLLAAAAFGLVFAAGDARELVHQINESNSGLASVAAVLIVLHLLVAAVAAALFPRRLSDGSGAAVAEATR